MSKDKSILEKFTDTVKDIANSASEALKAEEPPKVGETNAAYMPFAAEGLVSDPLLVPPVATQPPRRKRTVRKTAKTSAKKSSARKTAAKRAAPKKARKAAKASARGKSRTASRSAATAKRTTKAAASRRAAKGSVRKRSGR